MSFWRGIQWSEDETEGASSAYRAEMPLKFQSHWRLIITWLKARLGQVSGLALPRCFEGFCTLGHGMSLNKCPVRVLILLMTMLTDTQLIRGTWHYSEFMWLPFWLAVLDRASERLVEWGKIKEMSVPAVRNNRYDSYIQNYIEVSRCYSASQMK